MKGQQTRTDSLKQLIALSKEDTLKIILLENLGQAYRDEKKIDSSVFSYEQALKINESGNYWLQKQCWDIGTIDYLLYEMGNYVESLKYASRQLELSGQLNDTFQKGSAHLVLGHDYRQLGEYRQSLNHYFKAKDFFKIYWLSKSKPEDNTFTMLCIGQTYLKMNNLDSALLYAQQAYKIAKVNSAGGYMLLSARIFGDIFFARGDDEKAMEYYGQYISDFVKYKENNRDLGFVLNSMARIFEKQNQMDSTVSYAEKALQNAGQYRDQENIFHAAMILSDYYKKSDEHKAFAYFQLATQAKDSIISSNKIKQMQLLSFNEQVHEKEQEAADAKDAARKKIIIFVSTILVTIISSLLWYRIKQLRLKYKTILEQKESEKIKARYEKQIIELEAKALRAQMNPHFIFNCLNSIKSLIQQNENEKSVTYLTTFSKLIRTLFNNADKKEISLYDEIETCKLYLKLESMRFDAKFSFTVNVDNNLDLKSIHVPALIVQPFIENAVWHGIVPHNTGGRISLNVEKKNDTIDIIIDDDGIGRTTSAQNKSGNSLTHQSMGVNLTQSRLELNNLLQHRQAKMEIIDKKDANGKAIGTTVIIKLKEEVL